MYCCRLITLSCRLKRQWIKLNVQTVGGLTVCIQMHSPHDSILQAGKVYLSFKTFWIILYVQTVGGLTVYSMDALATLQAGKVYSIEICKAVFFFM